MTAPFSICVYCGSRPGVAEPRSPQAARDVGRWIGERGGQLVYGGGNTGLMGTVADATLGGRRHASSASFRRPWSTRNGPSAIAPNCTWSRPCTSASAMMAERADAFLALPGGIGTFEELFEVWTWRQLGYHDKPVGLLDTAGYYDAAAAVPAQQRARRAS